MNVNNPPNIPFAPNPSDGEIDVSTTNNLEWNGGDPDLGDTVTYDVYFGTTYPPSQVATGQLDTTYNPGTLTYKTKYYWKIVASDGKTSS